MQRLVNVADKVDDKAQGLRLLDRVNAGLQHFDVMLQCYDDVVRLRQVGRWCAVNREREVREVQVRSELKAEFGSDVIGQ